jgi:exopolysaccharide biosynthesis polyprenyl glycosylphosphotransferase
MFSIRVCLTNIGLACFDLAATAACYAVFRGITELASWDAGFEAVAALGLWLALSFYFGMYRSRRMDSAWGDCVVIFKVALASAVLVNVGSSLLSMPELERILPLRFAAANALLLSGARWALRLSLHELRRRGYDVKRLALISSGDLGIRLTEKIEKRSHYGYRIVRRFEYAAAGENADARFVEEFRGFLSDDPVDDVILALPVHAHALTIRLVEECEARGINVRIAPDLFPLIQTDTQIYDLDGIPLVNARLYPTESFGYLVFKRSFDLGLSVAGLAILAPAFALLAVLIKVTSPGPVFFTQDRVGLNGRRFRIIKFRTMRPSPSLDPDSHWTIRDDRHITPVGRWLRRFNIDELPQLFNVLKGEMSLVGPRPERPHFLSQFRREVPEYMARHYVKSGMTGWAQVNGWRGDTPIPERVAHDLYYIRNWTMSFDMRILVMTLSRTLFPRDGFQHEQTRGYRP